MKLEAPKEIENPALAALKEQFSQFDDLNAAHSAVTWDIFKIGDNEDQKELEKRLQSIKDPSVRDDAMFQLSKKYYEITKDLSKAKETALKIENRSERNRCLVHIANEVLDTEQNIGKANFVVKNYDIGSDSGLYYLTDENIIGKKSNVSGYSDTGLLDWLSQNLNLDKDGYLKYYLDKRAELSAKQKAD